MSVIENLYETRRKNVELLVRHYGSYAELNEKLGLARTNPHIALIVRKAPRTGSLTPRRMGHKLARKYEKILGLPTEWFDNPHINVSEKEKAGGIRIDNLFQTEGGEMIVQSFDVSVDLLVRLGVEPNAVRGLTVRDATMAPTLLVGDKCIVDISVNKIVTGGVYVVQVGDKVSIRRATETMSGEMMLSLDGARASLNETLPKNANVLGKVVHAFRGIDIA